MDRLGYDVPLKDSGSRRSFGTGAVRDVAEGKGRCDLLPLHNVARIVDGLIDVSPLDCIEDFVRTGGVTFLYDAIHTFVRMQYSGDVHTAMLEVAKQYEQGCAKYGDRNWEKGIPLHCYIDSGVRHYLKYKRGDTDEPHDRAFIWNMLGAAWTLGNAQDPELIDLPFALKKPDPLSERGVTNASR